MRKYIFLFCIMSALSIQVKAQVSYGSIDWGTYEMEIKVVTDNDSIFLNVIYMDTKRKLVDVPKLLIKTMDDEMIALDGQLLSSSSKSDGGVIISGIYVNSSHFISEAKFPITKEQISMFSKGIKKLRLNTSPKYHEKEWSRDKIGKVLYGNYKESSSNSFEDGF